MTTSEEKAKRALEIESHLAHFTGSETIYRHPLVRKVLYTEGVKYVAEACEAYWLIDKIASLQLEKAIAAEEFQAWRLEVHDGRAVLIATDGDKGDGPVTLHTENINFTDFPLDDIRFYVEFDGQHYTILLPSEH